jgi:hypothetical protein
LSTGGKNQIPLIAALAIVAVVVIAAVAYVMWPDDDGAGDDDGGDDAQPLFAHISFGLFTENVSSPTVKILVDVDGDGVMDTTEIVNPAMSQIGVVYSSSMTTRVVQLDSNASTFMFMVQVFDGDQQLMYSINDETHTGPVADGAADSWNYINLGGPMAFDCEITIAYQVLSYEALPF